MKKPVDLAALLAAHEGGPASEPKEILSDRELAEQHDYGTGISVTRIANLLDDGKTNAIANWAVRLSKQGEDHEKVRDDLGDRGTRIHAHLAAWNKGESVDALPDELPFLDAAEKWKLDARPANIEHEQFVASHLGFGGRFDSIDEIDGEVWGIDYKTGRLNDRENELQHAGYWNSDGISLYDDAGRFAGTRPLPPVTRWAVLKLHENGLYEFVEYPKRRRGQKDLPIKILQDRAWEAFCKLLDVYLWLHPTKGPLT